MNSKGLQSSNLIGEWSQVTESVNQIQDLLDSIVAARAESPCNRTSISSTIVADQVASLAAHLRSIFANEESNGFIADLYQTAPQLSDGISRLKDERIHLLGVLDEMSEILLSPLEPTKAGNEIEHHFRQFVNLLAHHEQSEDLLIQRTAMDDSGVVD